MINESNISNSLAEAIARLINIENKINSIIEDKIEPTHKCSDQFFGERTYAQHGDDLIILCLFHDIGINRPTYIDVGAHHPFNISNTALLYQRGSRGINVEPNPNLYANFLKHRPEDINLNIGVSDSNTFLKFYMIDEFSGRNSFDREAVESFCRQHPTFKIQNEIDIEVVTLNQIIDKYANGVFPDFLSIDVEGLDERIIRSTDFSITKPKVICVEIENSKGDLGSQPIFNFLMTQGYYCVMRSVSNLIFIEDKYKKNIGVL